MRAFTVILTEETTCLESSANQYVAVQVQEPVKLISEKTETGKTIQGLIPTCQYDFNFTVIGRAYSFHKLWLKVLL